MAQIIKDHAGVTTISHEYAYPFRIFLGALSLFPLLAPYELLIKPRWNLAEMDWQGIPFLLFFLFLGLAPLGITAALLAAAILGPNTTFSFDRYKRRFFYQTTKRFWRPGQRLELDFSDLPPMTVERQTDTDGPDYFTLSLQLPGQKKMQLARFAGEQPALELRDKLLAPL